jgi:hypothetical protein
MRQRRTAFDVPPAEGQIDAVEPGYSIDVAVAVPPADTVGNTNPASPEITVATTAAGGTVIAVPPSVELSGNVEFAAPAAPGTVVAVPPTYSTGEPPTPIPGPAPRPRRRPERDRQDFSIRVGAAGIRTVAVRPGTRAFQTELDDELLMLILNG